MDLSPLLKAHGDLSASVAKMARKRSRINVMNKAVLLDSIREMLIQNQQSGDMQHSHVALSNPRTHALRESTDIRFMFSACIVKNNKEFRNVNELVFSPVHMPGPQFAYLSLCFYAMHPNAWPASLAKVQSTLRMMLVNRQAFMQHWNSHCIENVDRGESGDIDAVHKLDITRSAVSYHSCRFPEFGEGCIAYVGNHEDLTIASSLTVGMAHVHNGITRALRDTMNAAQRMGIEPRSLNVIFDEEHTLNISVTPTTMHGHVFNLDARVMALPMNYAMSKEVNSIQPPESVLCLSCTGIRNDCNLFYKPGMCKRVVLETLRSVSHQEFGPRRHDIIALAGEHMLFTARSIGNIHLITQVGKSILKLRPESGQTDASRALIAGQKGQYLRDEVKLRTYYNAIKDSLTADEEACLRSALRIIHNNKQSVLTITCSDGSTEHHATSIMPDHNAFHNQSVHHVQAVFHVHGGIIVPVRKLGLRIDTIKVHIDNEWPLECNLLCYC